MLLLRTKLAVWLARCRLMHAAAIEEAAPESTRIWTATRRQE